MSAVKSKNQKLVVIIVVLSLVLVALIATALLLLENQNAEKPQKEPTAEHMETVETTETAETTEVTGEMEPTEDATMPTEAVAEKPPVRDYEVVEMVDGQIQTPYCILNYPEGLADHLLIIKTSERPYVLEFYAVMEGKQELRLFDLSFGEGSGGNMGTVKTQEGEVPLNVMIYQLSTDDTWSEAEITTAYAMQDMVNELLEQMQPKAEEKQDPPPVVNQQPKEESTIYNLEIETPYCKLYYPARWAKTVSFDTDDEKEEVYKVHFYSRIDGLENQRLFSIYFGGDEGTQLGAVMSIEGIPVPVYLIVEQLELDGLKEEEIDLLYTMQEASNQLIERLPLLQ